tara:strand:+ start:800 stop:1267 length:468 start_codon:yes stop_codon:yes gene_type:complete
MSYIPEAPNNYIGKQVIINSDRLIFNAKEDSILLFSNKAIGFSTNGDFHFDTFNNGTNKFIINAPKIILGLRYDNTYANEPAVLGNQTEKWLNELIDIISGIMDDMRQKFSLNCTDKVTGTRATYNKSQLQGRYDDLEILKDNIKNIMSKRINLV